MAPSRRRGANKSTALAARLKWKVGDLVLAKVKGFPAWPATVSEPQKWGYPGDLKKVLVYFFGTQQIAFCNPGDVEEFTEEKKVSLLGRRHGKSSDFVRALNEIVDCFEKVKKQNKAASDNITEETNITNENNSDESLAKSVNKEAPLVTVKQCSSGATNDLNSLTEAAAAEDALRDEDMQVEEANSNSVYTETPTYLTRSKTDATQSRKVGLQSGMSARKLRSSSRLDARGPQNSMLPSVNNLRSSSRLSGNVFPDTSLRRSKRIMKSSDDSEDHDTNSSAFLCNDSNEDDGSEIMTVGSDTLSLNDGSTADSGCKSLEIEPSTEVNEGEAELSDRLDFQTNVSILKKRRKPNRKRHRNLTDKLDEAVSGVEQHNIECDSPGNNEKVGEKFAKEGGDEHLPLVKRARVRMGRPSPAVDEEDTLAHKEKKTTKAPASVAMESAAQLQCKLDPPADGDSVPSNGGPGQSPPVLHASPPKSQYSGTGKNFMHGEAALPPSKRLHRALEAMSANVAEDSQIASSLPSERGCPSFSEFPELYSRKDTVMELQLEQVETQRGDGSQPSCSELCDGSNMEMLKTGEKSGESLSECGKTSHDIDGSKPKVCIDSCGPVKVTESRGLKLSPLTDPAETDGRHQHVTHDSTNIGEELSQFGCSIPSLMRSDGGKLECPELEAAARRSDSDSSRSDSILVGKIAAGSLIIDEDIMVCEAGGNVETNETKCDQTDEMKHVEKDDTKNLPLPDKNQDSQGSKYVKEDRPLSADSNVLPSATPGKVFTNTHSRATPPTSACKISASDSSSYIEKNSSNSPDIQIHIEKAKLASKSSGKLESLSSFEAIIRSLSRTKESIGRATRIAIDCAKVGFATKVVETLAHNLENESSPPKKVDLFFLVDSITQCSGGMKGDAGMYPLAIQALLPRLLLAAAPPCASFSENHRQCLKVLRVWLDRKILPEPIIRHHIRELDARCSAHVGGSSSRSLRFERPFDDPIREMEGMLVDEYGSNSSIRLPGFCMPPMLRDDDGGSDSDGESFEAVTPEHHVEYFDGEKTTAAEKRSHILQDVDGELEMEDVAPCCEVEMTSTSNLGGTDGTNISCHQSDGRYRASLASEQPKDSHLLSAPLPSSPLPPPPPAPQPHSVPPSGFPCASHGSVSNGPDSKFCSRSQEPKPKRSPLPRFKSRTFDAMHYRNHDNKDPETQLPRQMPDCSNAYPLHDQPSSRLSSRPSNGLHRGGGAFRKGFHVHPPHPAPSNQFSYVQEQRNHSRRNIPPPSQSSRFHSCNSENGNFYRDHDRDRYGPRDNIGEYWRPHLPAISGPCYHDGSRMSHGPMSYGGPSREPELPNNRWNFPPRSMNHRQYNHYRPPSGGPIPVANRGPSYWKSR